MSKPRYDWWGYVKGMIRRYPELCAKEKALHDVSISPNSSGLPGGKGGHSDPTAFAAMRELPPTNQRELDAVHKAVEATRALDTGKERLHLVRLVFWDRTHTLDGAAIQCHVSYRTARRWNGEFIRLVATNFGLLE